MTDELNKISASVEQKGPIDLETFKSFTKFHQAIVYRTFNVQMKLRNTILGDEFWEVLSKRRVKLSQGRSYMHINLIMTLVSRFSSPCDYVSSNIAISAMPALVGAAV
jgi:hypothetical protein